MARRVKRVPIDPAALALDAAGLDAIVADLRANGGVFTPTANWLTLDPAPGNAEGSSLLESCFLDEGVQARSYWLRCNVRRWLAGSLLEGHGACRSPLRV